MTPVPYRLGFAVKVLGAGGLRSADSRRWQSGPHLRQSVEFLSAVFEYLATIDVSVYRVSSQAIPYGTHPGLPQFDYRRQVDEAGPELDALARRATELGLRLSMHPGQYTVLNALDPSVVDQAIADVEAGTLLLDCLGQGPEAAVVVHVGGEYGDRPAALERWERTWARLSDRARLRLALENDERVFSTDDVLALHARTGVRIVLDVHHHRIHPASATWPLADALRAAIATWPAGVRPKVHLSSGRTTLDPPVPPRATAPPPGFPALRNHADLVLPWDLAAVVEAAPVALDVMLEAKAKDLALLHLRRSLEGVRPDLAALEERRLLREPSRRARQRSR